MKSHAAALLFLLPIIAPLAHADTPTAAPDPVQVEFTPGDLTVSRDQVLQWIHTAQKAVTHYYGRYPVPAVKIQVEARPGRRGNASGTTYGSEDGAFIQMGIGSVVSNDELQADWVMTHEMVHLAFPRVAENQHWIEEGLATYVEPVARAQIGDLSVDYLWQETIEGMPKGLPDTGDKGLDNTATWGRTYWGGAMFCLLADVQIRERTHNRYGLQDALRGILAAGGNIDSAWPLSKAFAIADKTVGVSVLEDLYAGMKDKPVDPNLPALWKKLGVALVEGKVAYDDAAPDAAIRKAITAADTQ